jgi:hypothetical protein
MARTSGVKALAESSLAKRKTGMKMFRIKTIYLVITLIATLINPIIAGTAGAAPAPRCALDQQRRNSDGTQRSFFQFCLRPAPGRLAVLRPVTGSSGQRRRGLHLD